MHAITSSDDIGIDWHMANAFTHLFSCSFRILRNDNLLFSSTFQSYGEHDVLGENDGSVVSFQQSSVSGTSALAEYFKKHRASIDCVNFNLHQVEIVIDIDD